ncbi:MAG: outer membrane beta-barrel protein [Legionellales bacterium]|nr:outer membrane beta-barrel protein [Legionellales bacterium]
MKISTRKVLFVSIISTLTFGMTNAFASSANGIYAGLQGGVSNTDYDSVSGKTVQNYFNAYAPLTFDSQGNNNLAGRIYLGYQFNRFFSTELGYAYLGNVTLKNIDNVSGANADLWENATDLTAKAKVPLPLGLNVFGLAGVAYANVNTSGVSNRAENLGLSDSQSESGFTGVYGVGAGWDIGRHFGLDAEWRHYAQNGSIPSTNAITAGFSIHI